MRTHRVLAPSRLSMHRPFAVFALCAAITLSACGDGGPSIRAEPDTTTTSSEPEPTTSTTTGTTSTTGTTTTVAVDGQIVRYQGLQFVVPTDWPVYDLAAAPRTCVRADVHAVYVGTPGPNPDCPAHLVGSTETVLVMRIEAASEIALARATAITLLNGMNVRIYPDPDANGTLTAVFPDLGVVAFVSYGGSSTLANTLLSGFTLVSP